VKAFTAPFEFCHKCGAQIGRYYGSLTEDLAAHAEATGCDGIPVPGQACLCPVCKSQEVSRGS